MRIEKKEEAVSWWVRCLNEIPFDMIDDLMSSRQGHIRELTFPVSGDVVVYQGEKWCVNKPDGIERYLIEKDDEQKVVSYYDLEFSRPGTLPERDSIWTLEGTSDAKWIDEPYNLYRMSQIGFRVYESDYGMFFGTDMVGVSLYDKMWTQMYDAMGKMWHSN